MTSTSTHTTPRDTDTGTDIHTDDRRAPPPTPGRSDRRSVWPIVATREVVVKLRDRNFLIGTCLTLVILAGTLGLQVVLAGRADSTSVAVTGDGARAVMEQVDTLADTRKSPITLTLTDSPAPAAVDAAVSSGAVDAGLVHDASGWRLVAKTEVDSKLLTFVGEVVRDDTLQRNAVAAGTTAQALTAGSEVQSQVLQTDANPGLLLVVGLVFAFLFYFASLTFGMTIAQSVVEEKQSRVVEILVSAVPLRQLLLGKIVGNCALALGQMVLYVGVGLVGMAFTSYAAQLGTVAASAGWFLVFFIAGFGALSCLWAVAGSLATRSEDLQATTPVLTMSLMIAMFVGLFATGTVRVVASYVPVVSTISMPQRLLAGEASWWEPFVSLLITLAFAFGSIVVGEKLYRRSVMHTGRRLKIREAMKQAV